MAEEKIVTDVTCMFCGALCDDLEVVIKDNKIIETRNACTLSTAKLFSCNNWEHRITKPMERKNGKLEEISLDDAIQKAAKILADAERPLLYGWANTDNIAIGLGLELAEITGGVFDNTATVCHGPSILGEQDVGVSTTTLGDVKSRADLVIFWGCNPMAAHPRHLARYSIFTRGFFRQKGVQDREMIVVDPRNTDTAKLADQFIQVEWGKDFELISAIRAVLKGMDLEVDKVAGVPKEEIVKLVEKMKSSSFGMLFFGLGLTMSKGKHRNIDIAISLIRDLNKHTKWVIMPLRGHWNVTGSNTVPTWHVGYPFAIDFSLGYPRYSPGEYTANDVLYKGECDAALIVASDPAGNFPKNAVKHMAKIPMIAIDPHHTPTTELSQILIPAAVVGVEAEGTGYRMDHVPLVLKKLVEPPEGVLTDAEILRRIIEAVKKLKE
ncbi:MAG: formylmethanofuran dehydrogenase subunit B [Candidatus Helarchaeota archaeon]